MNITPFAKADRPVPPFVIAVGDLSWVESLGYAPVTFGEAWEFARLGEPTITVERLDDICICYEAVPEPACHEQGFVVRLDPTKNAALFGALLRQWADEHGETI